MKRKWIGLTVAFVLLLGMALLYVFGPAATPMPLWMSILPPLVAIVMALLIKEVISSLFVGILTGNFLMAYYGGASPVAALGGGLLRVVDNPMDCSLPGSCVHGIFQARVLEWVPLPSPCKDENDVKQNKLAKVLRES